MCGGDGRYVVVCVYVYNKYIAHILQLKTYATVQQMDNGKCRNM